MSTARTSDGAFSGERLVTAGLAALALYGLGLGLFMAVAPGAFFDLIGPFGPQNDHYTRDNATYNLALGVVALIALRRASWRAPVLAFAVVQFGLHTVNHLIDIGDTEPGWIGPADFAALLLSTVLLAFVLANVRRGAASARGGAAGRV